MSMRSILFIVATAAIAGCDSVDANKDELASSISATGPERNARPVSATDPPGIHNLMQVSERLYSGSEPHGDEGFASLAKLGVKTVVSVDGAKPNVEAARKQGLRYVHIPIGYDGVSDEAGLSLARAAREVDAPMYVHCHHGKHRGPAAAAVMCIASGDTSNKDALKLLELAGTSEDYQGLWRDVKNYAPPAGDAELPELVEVAEVGSLPAAMSQVDRAFDNLKLCRDSNWNAPAEHPDLASSQEALLLVEGLHEAGRNLDDGYDDRFKTWLVEAETLAASLRSDLEKQNADAANERLLLLEKSCKQCHREYRDN